jgi:HEAT repeat protein
VGDRNHATPQQIEALIAAHVRRNTAAALGKLGDARSVVPLIAALADVDPEVRRMAADALGKLRDVRALPPLIATARDANGWVRSATAEALGELGDARAVAPLIVALGDADAQTQGMTVWLTCGLPKKTVGSFDFAEATERFCERGFGVLGEFFEDLNSK